ncbi:DNA-binding CsgD family transcriptional regulator [Flavobacteriaceae bacterium MAR_2009_75]|nr:DNA-binding CsgD family transcriptional regulator [Flavobacteriaceae bacterium MAR_2009_75]
MVFRFSIFFILLFWSVSAFSQDSGKNAWNLDQTFSDLNQKLKSAENDGDKSQVIDAHLDLGYFCEDNWVYTEALNQFNKVLLLLKDDKGDPRYANTLSHIGKVHVFLKNYDNAVDYFNRAIESAQLYNSLKTLASSTSYLGTCFEKKGNYIQALEYQNKSLKIYRNLQDSVGLSMVNESLGSIHEDLHDYKVALNFFKTAYRYHNKIKDIRLANILNNLGDIYRKTGKLEKGLEYTQMSLNISKLIGDLEEEASAYKDLSKSYKLSGKSDLAFQTLSKFLELDEANRVLYRANQASALQNIYDTKEKETRIQRLIHDSEIDKAQKLLLLLSICAVVVFTTLWFLYLKRKRREILRLQGYEKRLLQVELEKRQVEEENLQREVNIKNSSLSRYSLHLAQKNKMLSKLSQTLKNSLGRSNLDLKRKLESVVKEIDFDLAQEYEWDEFLTFFKEIHPQFLKKLSNIASSTLSPAEKRLSILLRLNLSSKEIASILRLTPDSVRVARYRLRKKLPVEAKEELSAYLTRL